MRYAIDIGPVIDRSPADAIRLAAEEGFDAIELGNRDDLLPAFGDSPADADDLRAVTRAAAHCGVEIASVAIIHDWSSVDESTRLQAVARWKNDIRVAADLGARRLNTELIGAPSSPDACREAFLRSMDEIVPDLERLGMTVSIEPHPGDFEESAAGAIALLDQFDHRTVRYLHCVPHTFYLGGEMTEQLVTAAGRFDHMHVADAFRPERSIVNPRGLDYRVHQHFDIGAGEIDWNALAVGLAEAGFDGLCTIQVYGWPERWRESFRHNRIALDRLFSPLAD